MFDESLHPREQKSKRFANKNAYDLDVRSQIDDLVARSVARRRTTGAERDELDRWLDGADVDYGEPVDNDDVLDASCRSDLSRGDMAVALDGLSVRVRDREALRTAASDNRAVTEALRKDELETDDVANLLDLSDHAAIERALAAGRPDVDEQLAANPNCLNYKDALIERYPTDSGPQVDVLRGLAANPGLDRAGQREMFRWAFDDDNGIDPIGRQAIAFKSE